MAVLIRRFPVQIGGLDLEYRVGDAGEVTATDRQGEGDIRRLRRPLSNAPPSLQPHFVFNVSIGCAFRVECSLCVCPDSIAIITAIYY